MAATAVKVLLIGYFLYGEVRGGYVAYRSYVANPVRPVLYGIWKVARFTRGGQTVPPLSTDPGLWQWIIFERPDFAMVRLMNGDPQFFHATYDAKASRLTLSHPGAKTGEEMTCSRPDPDHLTLTGTLAGQPTAVELQRKDAGKFPLEGRGFHWINEMPFNR